MCEASAYWLKNGQEELIMSEVDKIEPDGDSLRIISIFGEQKVVKAATREQGRKKHVKPRGQNVRRKG